MPRKAKEKVIENESIDEIKEKKSSTKTKPTSSTTSKKKKTEAKKITTAKKATSAAEKKETSTKKSDTKTTTPKKATTTKKATTSKAATSKKETTTKKASTTKKTTTASKTTDAKKKTTSSTKKTTAKSAKTTRKKAVSTKKEDFSNIEIIEYYDLPYKYGNTIVKLLAQTPKTLFVYWEISDDDIENFKLKYGDDFFKVTMPILIVHNLTLNKTSEVEVNDFANCWYLNTEDADCKYDIELARKYINPSSSKNVSQDKDYLFVAKSNNLESPNDHIMFEKLTDEVIFRNYKTNEIVKENIKSFKFLKDIYKFYQNMYKDELLTNPSSKF